jgi:hypothetical protein
MRLCTLRDLLTLLVFAAQVQTTNSQNLPKAGSENMPDFDVQVSCCETKPGVSRAVLTWHAPPGAPERHRISWPSSLGYPI